MNQHPAFIRRAPIRCAAVALVSTLISLAASAQRVECVVGPNGTGCVGPNGTVVAAPAPAQGTIKCADGVYRVACTGPNGTAVERKR